MQHADEQQEPRALTVALGVEILREEAEHAGADGEQVRQVRQPDDPQRGADQRDRTAPGHGRQQQRRIQLHRDRGTEQRPGRHRTPS